MEILFSFFLEAQRCLSVESLEIWDLWLVSVAQA
jgi:hypothetical protein